MPASEPFDELLALRPRMKALAVQLLGDDASAEDAVQEAFLAAIRRPPTLGHGVEGWFGTVTRRTALRLRHDLARRRRREEVAARRESVDGPAESVERQSMAEQLQRLVEGLGDPYSTVLRMRFFDELSNDAIAVRLDVPSSTVRTRMRRGLARLKEHLDDRWRGDRRGWMAALIFEFDVSPNDWASAAPVAAPAKLSAAGAIGALKLLLVATVVGLGLFWIVEWPADHRPAVSVARAGAPVDDRPLRSPPPPTPTERSEIVPRPATADPAGSDGIRFEVLVVDRQGRPQGDVPVLRNGETGTYVALGRTGADGRLSCDVPRADVRVHAATAPSLGSTLHLRAGGERWAPSPAHVLSFVEGRPVTATIPVDGSPVWIDGRLTLADGGPAAGVAVLRRPTTDLRVGERATGELEYPELRTRTDDEGRFSFGPLAPRVQQLVVRFGHSLFPIPPVDLSDVAGTYELSYQLPATATLTGTVERSDGTEPVDPVVWVDRAHRTHYSWETADSIDGEFEVSDIAVGEQRVWIRDGEWVAYFEANFAPGEVRRWDATLERGRGLRVRLVDAGGDALARVRLHFFLGDKSMPGGRRRPNWTRVVTTDDRGAVGLLDVPDGKLEVWMDVGQHDESMRRVATGLERRGSEQVLVVDGDLGSTVLVRAQLATADSPIPSSTKLIAHLVGSTHVTEKWFESDGSLQSMHLAPGGYLFALFSPSHGIHAFETLDIDGSEHEYDLGTIVPPPTGRLELEWSWEPGSTAGHSFLTMLRAEENFAFAMAVDAERLFPTYDLWPGVYLVRVRANDGRIDDRYLEIQPGESCRVAAGPDAPYYATARFALGPEHEAQTAEYRVLRVSDRRDYAQYEACSRDDAVLDPLGDPKPVTTGTVTLSPDRVFEVRVPLEAGTFAVEVELDSGLTGRRTLVTGNEALTQVWSATLD